MALGRNGSQGDPKQAQLDEHRIDHDNTQLTTDQGVKVDHTDDSLTVGERGPTLIEDFHFREKITRFDHERIPERVVHARGSGAYGHFECTDALADVTRAHFLGEVGRRTPVFVRFSTVGGSRGSADTVRDVRGFATKFYTEEGNFDLVGNNMPVFFIQDGIKFPDFVHAVKPEPHNEIPQASSAHDTFWDFVSLQPEATHMVLWLMSDRALPRSYRTMEGFGVHTFRFVNADGQGTFVKFHWRPKLGAHSLVWDETQKIAGKDPDFNRRDLWDTIAAGDFPEWELGVQLVAEQDEHEFDYDLLDPTKMIPEEDVPLRVVGRMVLDRNPDNFFAETEQVAMHVANVVPGIDFSNDPLMQARLFSYLDTQLIRLGGPNFSQLPVNRPVAEVHNMQRDGFAQHRIDRGESASSPNSIMGGCPHVASASEGAFRHFTERVDGQKIRKRSDSFLDHFSQATLFYNSQSEPERQHLVDALKFELGKVERKEIREREVAVLNEVDHELALDVAEAVGVDAPAEPARPNHGRSSPALSLSNQPGGIATRKVAVLAADGVDTESLEPVLEHLRSEGAICEILAPQDRELETTNGGSLAADRALVTMSSVLYDAVLIAGGGESVGTLMKVGDAVHYVAEAYKHAKPVGAIGLGAELLRLALAHSEGNGGVGPGVVIDNNGDPGAFASEFGEAIAAHRHFERELRAIPA